MPPPHSSRRQQSKYQDNDRAGQHRRIIQEYHWYSWEHDPKDSAPWQVPWYGCPRAAIHRECVDHQITYKPRINLTNNVFIHVFPPTRPLAKQALSGSLPVCNGWNISRQLNMNTEHLGSYVPEYNLTNDELADLAFALSLADEDSLQTGVERGLLQGPASKDRPRRGLINFQKTWMYANSRLSPHMPPMVIYLPTWRLLCLAAQASENVYRRARGGEREHFIDADWQHGTKAMVLQSHPIDDQNLIVFAVRGSQLNAFDWSINFKRAPTSPAGFLDDAGNACHAGFLSVARAMIRPVAARLRQLLEQNPSRASSSLLITGHSAGGAVAALLYAHMQSVTVRSELQDLTACFKRVHCITFGAPPLSLLPLQKSSASSSRKSVFMSFVNEGDLIARAEKAYVLSLWRVLTAPEPRIDKPSMSKMLKKMPSRLLVGSKTSKEAPWWPIPQATLSNAGRLIVLRERPGSHGRLEAISTTDDQLRGRLFGDPAMHPMTLYKRRVDELAVAAITGIEASP